MYSHPVIGELALEDTLETCEVGLSFEQCRYGFVASLEGRLETDIAGEATRVVPKSIGLGILRQAAMNTGELKHGLNWAHIEFPAILWLVGDHKQVAYVTHSLDDVRQPPPLPGWSFMEHVSSYGKQEQFLPGMYEPSPDMLVSLPSKTDEPFGSSAHLHVERWHISLIPRPAVSEQ
jgi:hypothetical protein